MGTVGLVCLRWILPPAGFASGGSSPEGQISGRQAPVLGGWLVWEAGVVRFACHPDDLPTGYHTGSRGPPCRCSPLGWVPVWSLVGLGAAPLIRRDRAVAG